MIGHADRAGTNTLTCNPFLVDKAYEVIKRWAPMIDSEEAFALAVDLVTTLEKRIAP